ncbi:uncharacterized protein [Nicotiana sylvestris]|uniref:uncharacterized protein n=1 Tax=Nicotiana sylvestris TaxID=4096 RepID=UPI00388C9F2D
MKAQALADHLAENPIDDEYQPLRTYFPDEDVNSIEAISEDTHVWKMFFDGAVNAKGVGIGAILILPIGQHYPATARLRFFCTNNTAEYEACIKGINMAIDQNVKELLIMGDSDLIIRQAQGEWETRDVKLIPYKKHVEDLNKRFKSIEFRYIPRCHNELADALATLASMLPYLGNAHIDPLEIQILERHGYCNTIEAAPNTQPWYHNIKKFLKTQEYPEQASGDQKRTIRRHASAITLKSVTKKAVVDFVHSNLICRFGIPVTIITDNAANLNSHLMGEICAIQSNSARNRCNQNGKRNVQALEIA